MNKQMRAEVAAEMLGREFPDAPAAQVNAVAEMIAAYKDDPLQVNSTRKSWRLETLEQIGEHYAGKLAGQEEARKWLDSLGYGSHEVTGATGGYTDADAMREGRQRHHAADAPEVELD